ncbi:AAA family ATPase [Methanosarcina mazei]|uniref:Rad50/SbcC-type AAA domain-containing protein n=4 Tax=Methanosarcina mazei TaxID=2209 RepID=A0A0F8DDK9_METMZ|nr:AAA family ATPase [Methanosarcina mazei]KKF99588.1 hypothetical protein DU31_10230 [Methanosarcina mazei]KKG25701.1 hypothetical protein DU52_01440 [Methanosarcina mazei]KKH34850.1 hypothetical protein DU54_10180 [Methanosarcina mazei]KKH39155.1 hypothetical protein DU50_11135 [Methanosarcina mazei]KKH50763.1 hypothetical protein DU85_06880 [Methanosarcina mazei]
MRFNISSIDLTNFRQYRGTQTINFDIDNSKNVSIILGKNGAGKSNILNALTWCFYGVEVHKDKETSVREGMPIINTSAVASLDYNQSTYAEVVVHIITNMGPWTIKRRIEGNKKNDGNLYLKPSELTVIYPVGNQDKVETGEDTQILVNNLLPEALKGFFFIDGEQLREFFKFSTPRKIADAIDKVSQLELLYKSEEHLKLMESTLRKGVKSTTPELEKVQREIQDIENWIEQTKKIIEQKEFENDKNNEELIEINSFLKENNIPKVSILQEERELIDKDIERLNKQIESREFERNNYLVDIAPFIYLKDEIEKSYKIIENKVEKGELPPQIRETFVHELLERGYCICGNDLNGESRKILEQYITKLALSELSEISIVGKTTIIQIYSDIKEFPEKIDKLNEHINKLNDDLEQKKRRKEQISAEIKDSDIDEIRRLENRRNQLERLIGNIEGDIKSLNRDLEIFNSKLSNKEELYVKEMSKDKKNLILKKKLSLVKNSLKTIEESKLIIKAKIRDQVERNTKNNFLTLIRKKHAFKDIVIDENYIVKVLHSHGYNVINDLSAGEYLILGLSFMSALMTISGFHAPVIIDTPLGKIDDEHRSLITTELPRFLHETQLVLLVTPTEYDHNVKKNLDEFLLKENYYEIRENEANTESMVWCDVNCS